MKRINWTPLNTFIQPMKRINWTPLNTFIIIGLPIIGCIIAAIITVQYQSYQRNKQYAEELAEAQRLITKRHAESKRHNQLSPLLKNPLDQPPSQPTDKPTDKDSTANMTDRIEHEGQIYRYFAPGEKHMFNYRYEDGMYKGLTYPEAYMAWKARRDEVDERLSEQSKIVRQHARAMIDSADAKLSTILTLFKSMPPKELEKAETETLKDYPETADEIESFFNDVANHGTTKSLEEIFKDNEFIGESDELLKIAGKQIWTEIDKLREERDQIDREKPQRPTF